MKNIQIIDGADNATFSIFQATDDEFALIFPSDGQDIEFAEDLAARTDDRHEAALAGLWRRPVRKAEAMGVHGTIFYGWENRRHHFPVSKREIDMPSSALNDAQRELFVRHGGKPMPSKP